MDRPPPLYREFIATELSGDELAGDLGTKLVRTFRECLGRGIIKASDKPEIVVAMNGHIAPFRFFERCLEIDFHPVFEVAIERLDLSILGKCSKYRELSLRVLANTMPDPDFIQKLYETDFARAKIALIVTMTRDKLNGEILSWMMDTFSPLIERIDLRTDSPKLALLQWTYARKNQHNTNRTLPDPGDLERFYDSSEYRSGFRCAMIERCLIDKTLQFFCCSRAYPVFRTGSAGLGGYDQDFSCKLRRYMDRCPSPCDLHFRLARHPSPMREEQAVELAPPIHPLQSLEQAEGQFYEGRIEAALRQFAVGKDRLEEMTGSSDYFRALEYSAQGHREKIIQPLEQSFHRLIDDYRPFLLRGLTSLQRFDGLAHHDCRSAVRFGDQRAETHTVLGLDYLGRRRFRSALTEFETALAKNPDYFPALFWAMVVAHYRCDRGMVGAIVERIRCFEATWPGDLPLPQWLEAFQNGQPIEPADKTVLVPVRSFLPPVPGPRFINLGCIDECMLRCQMCFKWRQKSGTTVKLPYERWRSLILELSECAAYNGSINFAGGEPLLYRHLIDLVAVATSYGLYANLCTNGYVLSDLTIDRLVEAGLKIIALSLDSTDPEIHDSMRGVGGVFQRILIALARIEGLAHGFKVELQPLISALNISGLGEILRFADRYHCISGVNFLALIRPHNSISVPETPWRKRFAHLWPEPSAVDRLIDRLISAKKSGAKVSNSIEQLEIYRGYYHNPEGFDPGFIRCHVGEAFVNVNFDGSIELCPYFPERSTRLGSVADRSFLPLWFGEQAFEYRSAMRDCSHSCYLRLNCLHHLETQYGSPGREGRK